MIRFLRKIGHCTCRWLCDNKPVKMHHCVYISATVLLIIAVANGLAIGLCYKLLSDLASACRQVQFHLVWRKEIGTSCNLVYQAELTATRSSQDCDRIQVDCNDRRPSTIIEWRRKTRCNTACDPEHDEYEDKRKMYKLVIGINVCFGATCVACIIVILLLAVLRMVIGRTGVVVPVDPVPVDPTLNPVCDRV